MPLDLATLRNDKAFDALTAAILDRDQPRTADLFYKMVVDEGRSVGEALSVVTAAEAPFVQVPNHINVKDGQVVLVNNDHTILGLRASADLAPYLPEQYRLLPMLQSVWYIPAGLDIWNQLLGKYPGRYATMKGMNVPPPDYGPVVWNQDVAPLREGGTLDERLNAHMLATMSGQVERSSGMFYTGRPDMAVGPLYYSLYDYICVQLTNAFPDLGKSLVQTNQTPLTPREVEAFVDLLMTGDQDSVFGQLTEHLKNGKSIRSLGDTIQLGAAELILRNTVPRAFTDGQHPFDYCNTANYWMRTSDSPYQPRVLYLMANFVNDAARANKWHTSVL